MKNIPIIIPVFNQLTYLKNLINWWRWYQPENKIYIVDNGSTYKPLIDFYDTLLSDESIVVYKTGQNNFIPNLQNFLKTHIGTGYDYYVISDPDIMPHPNTPPNFLEVFKTAIDNHKYHRAGFNLITSDLPPYLNEREMIIGNEAELLKDREALTYGGHMGYKAPIDTTFCLYKTENGGWKAPMDGADWGNCLRLFSAFHLMWYVDENNINEELEYYFTHAKYRVPGEPSAGKNNNRPKQYQ